jgi:hypothetical protein
MMYRGVIRNLTDENSCSEVAEGLYL